MSSTGRIVVGGDYTPAATAALRWAVAQAAVTSASVVVVHAFDVEGRADSTLERDLDRARRDARYRTQSWVVEVLADLDAQVPVIVSTPDGSVEEALANADARPTSAWWGSPRTLTAGVGSTPCVAPAAARSSASRPVRPPSWGDRHGRGTLPQPAAPSRSAGSTRSAYISIIGR
jgi:hypothetical protein